MQQLTLLFESLLIAGWATLVQVVPAEVAAEAVEPLLSMENLTELGLHAAGGLMGGMLCVLHRKRTSTTPIWDGVRQLAMAMVLPACIAGTIVDYIESVAWTFNSRLTLCAFLGLTAYWTVGWVLHTCEENENSGIIAVLKKLNLLKWVADRLYAAAGVKVPQEAADQAQKPTEGGGVKQ